MASRGGTLKSETLTRRERDEWWWVVHPRDLRRAAIALLVAAVAWWVVAWPLAMTAAGLALVAPWRWRSLSVNQWLSIGLSYLARPREMTVGLSHDVWCCRGRRSTRWRDITRHGLSGESEDILRYRGLEDFQRTGGFWRVHFGDEIREWVSDPRGDLAPLYEWAGHYRESWGALRRRDGVWVVGRITAVNARSDLWHALSATGHDLVIVLELVVHQSRDARRDVARLAHRADVEERWRVRQGFDSGRLNDSWMSKVQRRRDAVVEGDDLLEATLTVMVGARTRREAEQHFDECLAVAETHGAVLERGWGRQALWWAESTGDLREG